MAMGVEEERILSPRRIEEFVGEWTLANAEERIVLTIEEEGPIHTHWWPQVLGLIGGHKYFDRKLENRFLVTRSAGKQP
jgi:hypothetical protein